MVLASVVQVEELLVCLPLHARVKVWTNDFDDISKELWWMLRVSAPIPSWADVDESVDSERTMIGLLGRV